ncbi:MAG: sugar phosphate isomerase/epimerase [Clostridia bacterium]|nr:sugar phosphate isomerase/epimerase [Clostridia bacterium]
MINIALQLFSIDNISKEQGLRATLKMAAELGYNSVEFAGYFGLSIEEIKAELEKNGLSVTGAHMSYNDIISNYDDCVKGLKRLGAYSLCVDYHVTNTAEGWVDFANKLNDLGKRLRAAGILFGYHNHAHEFVEYDGKRAIDIIFDICEPENVFFEFDTRHCAIAKVDPVEYARKYKGRIPVLHARDTDMTADTAVGSGVVDFKAVIEAAEGIRALVVENGNIGKNIEQLRESSAFLKSILLLIYGNILSFIKLRKDTFKMRSIALQLFSIKDISHDPEKGLRESLKKAAELGYNSVEFAGYFGLTIDEIKEELKKYNLSVTGAHIKIEEFENNYEETVAGLKALGAYSACIPHAKFESAEEWADFGKRLDVIGKKMRKDGILFGFHNHVIEFEEIDGKRVLDIILENCEPENVFLEFDTRHCAIAKVDPVEYARKYKGRIPVLHARDTDMTNDTAVGSGVVDFKAVVDAAEGICAFVVENGNIGENLDQLRESSAFLKTLA